MGWLVAGTHVHLMVPHAHVPVMTRAMEWNRGGVALICRVERLSVEGRPSLVAGVSSGGGTGAGSRDGSGMSLSGGMSLRAVCRFGRRVLRVRCDWEQHGG
jgi:hypothetical protein